MKWLKPGIPTQNQVMQEKLREKLLAKARTKDELRERGELPETENKPKMKRVWTTYMGPSTIKEKKEDGTIVIKVLPDKEIYKDLVHEEEEVINMTAIETASEEDPDDESADDLSIVTVDSLANIDKDKVRDLWKQMSETKVKEAEIYNNLSTMVEDMTPAIIQETISKTSKPGTNIPACIEEFYEEIGSAAVFKRIVACGFMIYEDYLHGQDPTYKKHSIRKILKKFQTDSKGLLQVRKGEAYEREKKKTERMVKEESKIQMKEETKVEEVPRKGQAFVIPGMEGAIQVQEEDLYDPELYGTEEKGDEDMGEAEGAQADSTISKKRKRDQ